MDEVAAQAVLVPPSDVGDGVTTSIPRSEIEEVLASDETPIELVLDVARIAEGGETTDTRTVAVSWERAELKRLLDEAQGDEVTLTFDRETLRRAIEDDVEAHGFREVVLALAIAGTAAGGVAATASAEPGPFLGMAGVTPTQSASPDDRAASRANPVADPARGVAADDRAVSRMTPTPEPTLSPDDRAVPRATPIEAPTASVSPDDRAVPRTTPVPEPTLSPDDRAVPRMTPTPEPTLSPDDRAVPRATPVETPAPGLSPDDRAVPRGTPVEVPATGTVSDPGITWSAPSPAEAAVLAGVIALAITGAYFIVGGRRRPRVRPT